MCMCSGGGCNPSRGIRIVAEIHDQFPQEVKDAWQVFYDWLIEQDDAIRKNMPENVAAAYKIMCEAPIPGYEGLTGKDSCFVIEVEDNFNYMDMLISESSEVE